MREPEGECTIIIKLNWCYHNCGSEEVSLPHFLRSCLVNDLTDSSAVPPPPPRVNHPPLLYTTVIQQTLHHNPTIPHLLLCHLQQQEKSLSYYSFTLLVIGTQLTCHVKSADIKLTDKLKLSTCVVLFSKNNLLT